MHRFAVTALFAFATLSLGACAADPTDAEPGEVEVAEDPLVAKADEHWFYTGALPKLDDAAVTLSLKGHTVRVSGLVPAGVTIPAVPHGRARAEGDRTRLDLVYPIATANVGSGKSNSRPGQYAFSRVIPYRPDGITWTRSEGNHMVPWGGFPFIAYNQGIAMHGPITDKDNKGTPDVDVWYLRRGQVSGGCNRMLGEHVVELAHVLGANMRRVYGSNRTYGPREAPVSITARVTVIAHYDRYGDKLVDVDYPTDVGAVRPAKIHGADKVEMFGSWVATEAPDGSDLPPDMQWEAGASGRPYVFKNHAIPAVVCSMPKSILPKLGELAGSSELPKNLCAQKACYVDALRAGGVAAARERCAQ